MQLAIEQKICVIGLGYVGLPLLLELNKHFNVVGFDVSLEAVRHAKQVDPKLVVSSMKSIIADCTTYIVCVPTPVNEFNEIDLEAVLNAFETVSEYATSGCLVILESTVSPGTTRSIAAQVIENKTGLKLGKSFFLGYSPERLAPGSTNADLSKIKKLISGCSEKTINMVRKIYEPIITAGLHTCETIEIAEAAKLLENIQRDVNISLFNEFGSVCSAKGVDFEKVVEAASTKWNFHRYQRGLVGGHCISVDPYYFISYAEGNGLGLEVISAARRVNSSMVGKVYSKLKYQIEAIKKKSPKILYLGVTYKENIDDIRNSGSLVIAQRLCGEYEDTIICDPVLNSITFCRAGMNFSDNLSNLSAFDFDVIIVGVAHTEIIDWAHRVFAETETSNLLAPLKLTLSVSDQLKGFKICL